MLTIHNPAFQGICDRNDLWNYFNLPEYYFDNGLARLDDKVNLLKAAICLSDIVTTVSPTHRDELRRAMDKANGRFLNPRVSLKKRMEEREKAIS